MAASVVADNYNFGSNSGGVNGTGPSGAYRPSIFTRRPSPSGRFRLSNSSSVTNYSSPPRSQYQQQQQQQIQSTPVTTQYSSLATSYSLPGSSKLVDETPPKRLDSLERVVQPGRIRPDRTPVNTNTNPNNINNGYADNNNNQMMTHLERMYLSTNRPTPFKTSSTSKKEPLTTSEVAWNGDADSPYPSPTGRSVKSMIEPTTSFPWDSVALDKTPSRPQHDNRYDNAIRTKLNDYLDASVTATMPRPPSPRVKMSAIMKEAMTSDVADTARSQLKTAKKTSSGETIVTHRSANGTEVYSLASYAASTTNNNNNNNNNHYHTTSASAFTSSSSSGGGVALWGHKDECKGNGIVGLCNLGNTCFMNSVIQCLSHTLPLRHYFVSAKYRSDINRKYNKKTQGRLAEEFGAVLTEIWTSRENSVVSPNALKSQIGQFASQFRGYQQHDSQELLRFLLDGLHEDLLLPQKDPPYSYDDGKEETRTPAENAERMWANFLARNASVITRIFSGQFMSTVQCCVCSHKSNTFDPFMDLSVPIPKRNGFRAGDGQCSLDDCLNSFFEDEKLTDLNQYYCSKCKKHRDAIKRLSVFRLPQVVVIHLKRFSKSSWSGHKLNTAVHFPIRQLDLSKYYNGKDAPFIYDLFAVSNHMGGMGGGHYVAHCKGVDNCWRCFDDSRVSLVNDDHLVDASAYLLFYRAVERSTTMSRM